MLQRTDLAVEFRELGWLAVPIECPQRFRDKILEKRAAMLAHPEMLPRRSHATAAPLHLSAAELRRKARQVGLDIKADEIRERIAETGMAIQITDEDGKISFRGPTDAEWSASLQRRAAQVTTQLRAEAIAEARQNPWEWDNRQGCWVSRLERMLKEQSR